MTDTQEYIVNDQDKIKSELHLENKPTGLIVIKQNNRDACTVKPIPPDFPNQEEVVSDDLLQSLLEDGAIKVK